jgi:hypothetical protein
LTHFRSELQVPPRKVPRLLMAAFCGSLLAITGCVGYRLGPSNGEAPRVRSVQVIPFENQTLEPRLTDALTGQLRKQLQREGTYRVASHDDGDIIVSGAITGYQRFELSFHPNDTLTARDYRLTLIAKITARERGSGKIMLDQRVSGSTLIRVGNDLTSTERQALPLLAGDLARNITDLLADGAW